MHKIIVCKFRREECKEIYTYAIYRIELFYFLSRGLGRAFNKSLSKEFSPSSYTDVKVGDVRTLTGGSNYMIISDLSSVRVIISGVAQVSVIDVILEVSLE
jgi:hypothetical protein